ncbi:MAG: DUF3108 domain-containing protein [Rhizobacter sp.]|nr:DUF3108 domain-containing protein [Burkholderiales bacterium]
MSDLAVTPAKPAASAGADAARYDMARAIVRRRGLLATPPRKLIAAIVVSIVAHLLLGSFAEIEPPEEKFAPIKAKFVNLPPPPLPVAVSPAVKPAAKPKPRAKPKPSPAVVADSPVAIAAPDPVVEPGPEPALAAASAPEPAAAAQPVAEPAPVVVPEPTPVPLPVVPPEPPARMPPKKIDLAYTAFLGEQKFEVGPVNLSFTHDAGRYKLVVKGRGRGLAALLYPGTFTGESEGKITSEGLRPDKFTEERGNPEKRREVIFDHEKGLVRIPDKEPIPFEGAPHDPLTWIVQFYFAAPKGDTITFSVGSSRRMDVYTLVRAGDEKIDSPAGEVVAQVWKGGRKPEADGKPNGSATFWLVPAWHYVPFKLKMVNAQGRSASFELTAVNAE